MIEKQIIRALVLEVIGKMPKTQINHIITAVEELVKEQGLFPNEEECQSKGINYQPYREKQLSPDDTLTINEVIWDLIREGVLNPGENQANQGFPFLRLSKFGQDYISQSAPHHYDPNGYMVYLRSIVHNLDHVIEQYVFESVRCYRQQLFFASAVMIGAASEKAILLLLQALTDSMGDPTKKRKATKLLEKPNLPDIFRTISNNLNPLITSNTIPYSVHQGSTEHLMSLLEMIRVERNDAIHPISGQVDSVKVFLSLQTIPIALASVNKLIDWLHNNSIP
ncbi:MAG: hypothetical protein WC369_08215 [Dehalococcoidales bacterium]|jgi:hypothetical protein